LVPVIYAIFVLDLKLVKWEKTGDHQHSDAIVSAVSESSAV
jgi:hypothetical protein